MKYYFDFEDGTLHTEEELRKEFEEVKEEAGQETFEEYLIDCMDFNNGTLMTIESVNNEFCGEYIWKFLNVLNCETEFQLMGKWLIDRVVNSVVVANEYPRGLDDETIRSITVEDGILTVSI